MVKRIYNKLPDCEIEEKVKAASLNTDSKSKISVPSECSLEELPKRLEKLLKKFFENKRKVTDMLIFVMYDIESNKVRRQVAKYLLGMGCFRIQHSIFLADLPPDKVAKIKEDLTEVQECYDNHDSILVVPISTEYLRSMKVIGKNINIDLISKNQSTLFF